MMWGRTCGGGVWLQQRLSYVTDQWGGGGVVRVGGRDEELYIFLLLSALPSLSGISAASSRLQLAEWAVIGPGLVLLVLVSSGQVSSETVQVLGQALEGGGGGSRELWSIALTFRIWTRGHHSHRAGRRRSFSGPLTTPVSVRHSGHRGCRRRHWYNSLYGRGGWCFLREGGHRPTHCTHTSLPASLTFRIRVVRVWRQQIRARTPSAPSTRAVLQVGRDESQRTGTPRSGKREEPAPQVATTTRGGKSEGGEAKLRPHSQTQVFQDGRLTTERKKKNNY